MNTRAGAVGALGFLVLIGGGLILVSLQADETESAFDRQSRGARPLVEDARALGLDVSRLLSTPSTLRAGPDLDPKKTLLAVVGPQREYTDAEAADVRSFLEAGGRLLVADDFGQANTLTSGLGVTFERVRLVEADPDQRWNVTVASRAFRVWTSQPTALHLAPGLDATVRGFSSPSSYVDRDGNGIIDAADPRGPLPVIVQADVGDEGGTWIALADTGPLTVPGADESDNRAWRRALLDQLLPEGGRLVIDESRQTSPDPVLTAVAAGVAAAASTPWNYVLAAVALILLGSLALPFARTLWSPHRFRPQRFLRRATFDTPGVPASGAPLVTAPVATAFWTRRGLTALLGGGAVGLLGVIFGSSEAAYVSAFLLAAAAAALVAGQPRVTASRTVVPAKVQESAHISIGLELSTPRGHQTDLEFRDELPQEFDVSEGNHWFLGSVHRDAPTTVSYTTTPALRGPYDVGPLYVRRRDVLGLRLQQTQLVGKETVLVTPRQESVRRTPSKTKVPTVTIGPHLVNRQGDGSEFHSLREYQMGDPFRSVNWKASARTKTLMVNQRVHESLTQLTILLDTRSVSAAGPASRTPLAQGCRAVLSVAAGSLKVRDRVRVLTYGEGVHELCALTGTSRLTELADMLAAVRGSGSGGLADAVRAIVASVKPGTPVLVCSGLESDPSLAEGVRLLRSRGLLPFVLAAPIGTDPVYEDEGGPEPGAQELKSERQATVATLRALDVPVFETLDGLSIDDVFRSGGGA